MKRACKLIFALTFFLVGLVLPFQVQAEYFTTKEFQSDVIVHSDASLTVTETITVDFGENQRHGIFRTLPTRYKDDHGNTRSIRIDRIQIKDGDNRQRPFETSSSFSGERTIKIGDPGIYVTGQQIYQLTYRVRGALNYFTDHDELYWNAIGTSWPTSIDRASASVTIPGVSSPVTAVAYQGERGSTVPAEATVNENQASFQATSLLLPGEGLTIVAGWEPGVVHRPTLYERWLWFLEDNLILLLPIIVSILVVRQFIRHGKDPAGRATIIAEYEPVKELSLLEQAALRDERLSNHDLTALIIHWAVLGYVRIHEPKKGNYELIKQKELDQGSSAEKEFFQALFSSAKNDKVELKSLAHTLHTEAEKLRTSTFSALVQRGYFVKNPRSVLVGYFVAGMAVLFMAFAFGAALGLAWIFALGLSGVVLMIAAPFMPKRTQKGVRTKQDIQGFELFMRTVERDRMKFYEKAWMFEKYLPYAIVFGMATMWAKAFKDIAASAPDWYTGYGAGHWSTVDFSRSVNTSLTSSLSAATSTASSGGSGFSGSSGGGFGGGGGGSW